MTPKEFFDEWKGNKFEMSNGEIGVLCGWFDYPKDDTACEVLLSTDGPGFANWKGQYNNPNDHIVSAYHGHKNLKYQKIEDLRLSYWL